MRRSHLCFLAAVSLLANACSYSKYVAEPAMARTGAPAEMPAAAPPGTEQYTDYGVNGAIDAQKDHLSTFAVDVDTASYSISRRFLLDGALPPVAAVRVEEFVNSFGYDYPRPTQAPLAVYTAGAPSPFAPGHTLLRVALQGRSVSAQERRPVHLVYLVDTSGSMAAPNKLGLAKESLRVLTGALHQGDTVALCTYAGSVRLVLPPTGASEQQKIFRAIDDLDANGSTAMSSGIQLAYDLAAKTHVAGDVSRVVVLSDGDANVGNTNHDQILETIAQYKKKGITLSTVGLGNGNYKDTMMEQLADRGDGNYSYIDAPQEAHRVFAESVDGLLQVIARDVKVQVDFDPTVVKEYRLIGYENRDVADHDFKNDKVDGGEIGAGHTVTALYDVVLQPNAAKTASPLTVHVRAKPALGGEQAVETAFAMDPKTITARFDDAPASFRFATAVASFAEVLRKSPAATYGLGAVQTIAAGALEGKAERSAFLDLVGRAQKLEPKSVATAAR